MKARRSVAAVDAYPLLPGTRRDKIRLDLNESDWGCSPKVLEALRNLERLDVSAYPDYHELLDKIARRHALKLENILLTNGADDGIRAVMQTYLEEGDEVILAQPSFGMIRIHAAVMGARIRPAAYQRDLQFPTGKFLEALSARTKLIAVVRPDSPAGAVIPRAELQALLREAPHSLIMLDETYHHFSGDSCIDLLKRFQNLLILQSFSKAYGLAGLRLGFIAGEEGVLRQIRKVNPPFATNAIAVIAGITAIDDTAYLAEVIRQMQQEKAYLITAMQQMGLAVRDSAANFILLDVGIHADQVHGALLERNILVKNLSSFPVLKGHFRVAVGTRRVNEILLGALKEIMPRVKDPS